MPSHTTHQILKSETPGRGASEGLEHSIGQNGRKSIPEDFADEDGFGHEAVERRGSLEGLLETLQLGIRHALHRILVSQKGRTGILVTHVDEWPETVSGSPERRTTTSEGLLLNFLLTKGE